MSFTPFLSRFICNYSSPMSRSYSQHYCIFRTDGIGDVILTLPMAVAIKQFDSKSKVTFCVRSSVQDIVELAHGIDSVIATDEREIKNVSDFAKRLKSESIDIGIFPYPRLNLVRASQKAKIPIRIGTSNRWYSFFFTHRVREHRSEARYHESEYNLHMLDHLKLRYDLPIKPELHISDEQRMEARAILDGIGLSTQHDLIILHPGSSGSAKDWSAERFGMLGKKIIESFQQISVLVTGSEEEQRLIHRVKSYIPQRVYSFNSKLQLTNLVAIISLSRCIIANSTGPLHIGAASGVPVIGLYPNKRVCNPKRWGPISERAFVFTPEKISSCKRCELNACEDHDQMDRIRVEDVFNAVKKILDGTQTSNGLYQSADYEIQNYK